MYESPIEMFSVTDYVDKISKQIDEQTGDIVWSAVTKVGVNVNKEELIRALKYDRGQYEEGYIDGKRDAIVWHPYPEEKPRTSGRYLCVCQNEILTFGKFRIDSWEVLDERYGYIPYWGVKWWAELPDTPVCRRENAE